MSGFFLVLEERRVLRGRGLGAPGFRGVGFGALGVLGLQGL